MASSEPPSSPVHNVAPEYRFKAPQISVAINPVALVTSECITVTSAMRKNARWAQSSVSAILGGGGTGYGSSGFETPVPGSPSPMLARRGDFEGQVGMTGRWGLRGKKGRSIQDNPLMAAFAKLRGDLQECSDISKFDTPSLLHPFLQVIRSSSTSGPITSLALVAITKFFSYNLITRNSPRLSLAMQLLSSAVTHCRFEASDSAQDEVVLLRILKLMEMMISGPGGEVLGDESVCEMMETGLSMCCQMRLSEMLRRSAEMGMVTMCQVIFQRLKTLELEADESGGDLDEDLKNEMDSVKMEPAGSGTNAATAAAAAERSSGSLDEAHPDRPTIAPSPHDVTEGVTEPRPYSLPSIRELLRVLVELLDPHDLTNTDTKRIMAMRIIDVAFEVAGPSIAKHPSLADLARDSLCKYLFQLVRSDTMGILQESLRVTTTLLATTRGVLKLQQELFISYLVACLHPQIEIPREPGVDPLLYEGVPQAPKLVKPAPSQQTSGRSTPVPVKERQKLGLEGGIRRPDAREAMVECIGALSRIPSFMVELYVNYDCNVDRADLCEDVVGLLSRNAFPDSATWSTTNVPPLCLDALLGYVNFIAERLRDNPVYEGFPRPEELQQQRAKKQVVIDCIAKFNEDPKKGIIALAQEGIIKNVEDAESIAKFLQGTSRVNKKILGEFLSKKQNEEILKAFMNTFDFAGKRADEALREILETFRLPGESQLIERIVTKFSERYCEAKENLQDVADEDSAFVLTYAIIMLNTDQHNPNMKNANRMKYEEFARNLRGVNGGKDFDPAYLQNIYDTIKNNEIILPDEHDNKHAFDYTWRELLHKTESAGELLLCNTNIYDAQMFATTWKPIVATLSYVFISATDDAVFSRVITGFDQCARIAAAYNITEALDDIVHRLSIISKLSSDEPPNTSLNTEIQVNGNSVMVSEMAVKFGRDFKAQLATVVMFRVVTGNEAVLNAGWDKIVRAWLNLFVNKLIPPFFSPSKSGLDLPPIPLQPPSVVIDRDQTAKEVGLFSTLSSYLSSYANDEPPEPSDEELDCTLTTVDCVNACFLGDVFANIMELSSDSLQALIESLLRQVPDWDTEETEVVITKPNSYPTSPMAGVSPIRKSAPTYDPALVYILEFTTCLVLRDDDTTAAYGKPLATTLTSVIRNATRVHPLVISRTIYYLFSLLETSHEHSFLNPPIVLHSVTALENTTLEKSAHSIIKGLGKCVRGSSSPLRNSIINSPDFWVLLRALLTDQEIVEDVFSVLSFIADDAPHNVTSDNYLAAVSLLNDFASEASIGSNYEQKADKDRFLHASQGGLKRSASSASRKSRVSTEEKASEQALNGSQPPKNPAASTVARGVKAISTIQHLTSRVPSLITSSHLEPQEAWATYWLPIFQSLSSQCTNPCREVRSQALAFLRQCLLSPTLTIDKEEHNEWTAIFGDVLFPLITRLLKPEVFQCDPRGMAITRVETAKLLLTVFAHYLVVLTEWDGMLGLWCRILDVMDRLMNSGQGYHLEEAVSESLKNILLVMAAGGYLIRPEEGPSQDKQELWEQTWRRLERFLPDMKAELFPPLPAPPIKEDVPPVPPSAPTEPENNGEKGTVEVTVGEVEANGDAEEIKVQEVQQPQRVDDEID
ncbi:Sec7-domain-containing protein [Ascodesmis nigricans]|uniref:Sec7-domain-containing protein n=1 Tax=Ascodesmis nigricans TaxID=341454 RepID=A0A4V3SJJ1_9PEZI|nr:Sec7-domain-containing protein [Ascodesmis nigricans]